MESNAFDCTAPSVMGSDSASQVGLPSLGDTVVNTVPLNPEGMELKVRDLEQQQQQQQQQQEQQQHELLVDKGMHVDVHTSEVGSSPAEAPLNQNGSTQSGMATSDAGDENAVVSSGALKRRRVEETEVSAVPDDSGTVEAVQVTETEKKSGTDQPRGPRYRKRKIALFVSYSGFGYQGMQRNKGAKTIEGDLEEALFKAGAIAESTYGDPRKIDWARAARTDKGVSAAGQVVSGRFFIDPPGFVERVNSHLPQQIRVLGFTRVTGTFNAKNLCDRRRYEYVLPVFALDPASHLSESPQTQPVVQADDGESNDVEDKGVPYTCQCSSDSDSGFSFGEEERKKLNRILQKYVGTHYFHNFTCRIKPEDPSTQRYIISYEASDVFTIEGKQFVRCTVVGQSFMLHQIRKMIGLAVAVMRGCAPESIFETAFRRDVKIAVPMAPELGLFLDECLYTAYNQRFSGTHEEVSLKEFDKQIADFKREVIYPHIASTEAKDKVFANWLHGLTDNRYPGFASERERVEKERVADCQS